MSAVAPGPPFGTPARISAPAPRFPAHPYARLAWFASQPFLHADAEADFPMIPAEVWHGLLRPDVELTSEFCDELAGRMRNARLTFGDRIHCPFLRPFFLSEEDERRVQSVAETIAALGERVVAAALSSRALLGQLGIRPEEEPLIRIDPGYPTASTASRLDAFLLPDSLQFAEYNAESPAGPGYSETLAQIFDGLGVMDRFKAQFHVRTHPLSERLLAALLASYREWGGAAPAPLVAIVDWREVPTWTEFEILQSRFERLGVPTIVVDPRDLEFHAGALIATGRRIDLVYRRVLVNDIVARPDECGALVAAYRAGAVCLANALRCKIAHKKAFFAVLTDDRNRALFSDDEREAIRRHVPWTRMVEETKTDRDGEMIDLLPFAGKHRDRFVLKPNDEYGGAGVMLGWEVDQAAWDCGLERALNDPRGSWILQERIAIRRERFPQYEPGAPVVLREMLVDFAPYLFRGRLAGYLTRLSATGLANVTSGGGQVPAFVVSERSGQPG